ncbi:MAG: flagellar brake protein [Rhodocyclaceae bacterium]|nr:flagellar brake protein [Rhodocyclaceae bacterium]
MADATEQSGKDTIVRLEDVKLLIGDTLQLQSQADQGMVRYYVKLIGYAVGKSVLVTTPVVDGKICLMREGQSFVVRCFSGKNAYAFPAATFKVVNTPFPHMHLSYPREVRGIVVRKGARVNTNIIAAVQILSGERANTPAAANITNLSVGGALLAARTPLGVKGDRISVKFRVNLDEIEAYPQLEGVIRNVATDTEVEGGGIPPVMHGVEFKEVSQPDRVMITAYVYRRMLEDTADD